jgi:23S rRNA pseudouridine1911/1915/1917 synthase
MADIKKIFKINEAENGVRLDRIMAARFKDKTRQYIQKLIEDGFVLVDGKISKSGRKLKIGEKVNAVFPAPKELELVAAKIPLKIVYEDKNLLIVDKPAGMVVHPGAGQSHIKDSMVNAVLHYCKGSLSGIGGVLRPGIVHRLDKDTSGLLIVAKNDKTHQYLMNLFKERHVEKNYFALLCGHLSPEKGTIEAPIGRARGDRKKMAVSEHGKEAVTKYRVMKYFKGCTYVEIRLITGRTHQIRVHFNSIGFPVIGDTVYGNLKVNKNFEQEYGLSRLFLHAGRIGFVMPGKKELSFYEAPLPAALKKVLKLLSR